MSDKAIEAFSKETTYTFTCPGECKAMILAGLAWDSDAAEYFAACAGFCQNSCQERLNSNSEEVCSGVGKLGVAGLDIKKADLEKQPNFINNLPCQPKPAPVQMDFLCHPCACSTTSLTTVSEEVQ